MADRRYRTLSVILILLAIVCITAYNNDTIRVPISRLIKHGAICFLQNHGIIATHHAHYTANRGTVDIVYCTPSKAPVFYGAPMDRSIIVVSDLGHVVQRINKVGHVVWTRSLGFPRGIDIRGKEVYIGDQKDLLVLNVDNGITLRRYHYNKNITAVKIYQKMLFLAVDDGTSGQIVGYNLGNIASNEVYRLPIKLNSARGFDISKGLLVIADTFKHRVLSVRLTSSKISSTKSFFPNSVQIIGGYLLVAEEHINVVSRFSLDLTKVYHLAAGCFDRNKDSIEITERLKKSRATDFLCDPKHNRLRLYSPNDAFYDHDSLYIADTDNHRILVFKNGVYHTSISGFNNPINIRVVD